MHTIWTGERVRLRPFRDAEEFVNFNADLGREPNHYWGPWWDSPPSMKSDFEGSGMLSNESYSAFAIERLDSGELVGFEEHGGVAAGRIQSWVGTYISEEHWGRGFGIEAKQLALCFLFENYPIERVEAGTVENHLRAARGLKQCGMHYEGRLRKVIRQNGQWFDLLQYAIFREEWERLPIREIVRRS